MNEHPRQKLAELAAKRRDFIRDPRLCKNLLADLCGPYRGEIRVLVAAVEEGVAAELLDNSAGIPKQALIARLSKRLHDECRLSEEDARWAVESWALALGVIEHIEERKRKKAPIAFIDKETDKLRTLLEAGQYSEAVELAKKILVSNRRNALAHAAMSWLDGVTPFVANLCFVKAWDLAGDDPVIAKVRIARAACFLNDARTEVERYAASHYRSDLYNPHDLFWFAGGAIRLNPELKTEVMEMVVAACKQSGTMQPVGLLKSAFERAVFSECFVEDADQPGWAVPKEQYVTPPRPNRHAGAFDKNDPNTWDAQVAEARCPDGQDKNDPNTWDAQVAEARCPDGQPQQGSRQSGSGSKSVTVHCKCPTCGRSLKVEEKLAGKVVPCPACRTSLRVLADLRLEDASDAWNLDED